MGFARNLVVVAFVTLMFHNEKSLTTAEPAGIFTLVHDLIQYNVAGVPVIHEKTQWDFDPEVGKKRRARYEEENGRHGEVAIAKIGMGIGYKGPWGTPA